jgi:hypothetical protein
MKIIQKLLLAVGTSLMLFSGGVTVIEAQTLSQANSKVTSTKHAYQSAQKTYSHKAKIAQSKKSTYNKISKSYQTTQTQYAKQNSLVSKYRHNELVYRNQIKVNTTRVTTDQQKVTQATKQLNADQQKVTAANNRYEDIADEQNEIDKLADKVDETESDLENAQFAYDYADDADLATAKAKLDAATLAHNQAVDAYNTKNPTYRDGSTYSDKLDTEANALYEYINYDATDILNADQDKVATTKAHLKSDQNKLTTSKRNWTTTKKNLTVAQKKSAQYRRNVITKAKQKKNAYKQYVAANHNAQKAKQNVAKKKVAYQRAVKQRNVIKAKQAALARARHRAAVQRAAAQSSSGSIYTGTSQTIIGNSRSMIYHVPGQAGYHMSSANAVYFSSEAQAQAAGYRKSLR